MARNQDNDLDYDSETSNVTDLYDSVVRENPIREAGNAPVSLLVFLLCAGVLLLAGGQLFSTSNGFKDSNLIATVYQPAPRPQLGGAAEEEGDVAWIDKWMSEGKKVYGGCVSCHQANGNGMPGVFPPLVDSEWVNGGTQRLTAVVLHGATGPMSVGGQTYNGAMPAWVSLGDEKVAQVLTYIRREYGAMPEGEDGVVTTEMVRNVREQLGAQPTPYTEPDLLAIPADAQAEGAKVDLQTGQPLPN